DALLDLDEVGQWIERWGREPVRDALRDSLGAARDALALDGEAPSEPVLLAEARRRLELGSRPSLRSLLNGTGVVLHTNFGRAPIAPAALKAVHEVAAGYSNLEYELELGRRGSRYAHCVELIAALTGAEDALVVNNNAAAVALSINELALGREVIVSRGELVEIGGSFRIPDIVSRAGATLREVGTTNRTRLTDYQQAMGPNSGLVLRVHPSNYRVEGFVSGVELQELAGAAASAELPLVHDLGSGLLMPEWLPGFPEEPGPRASLSAGADLVTWSADKLLGGPQAGILAGTASAIGRIRQNPLLRAFRVGKMTLAALEATLRLYRDPALAAAGVPALAMLLEPAESVEMRARVALEEISGTPGESNVPALIEVVQLRSLVGGGSFPGHEIESWGLAVSRVNPDEVEAACRAHQPPLIGRVEGGRFLLDVRTLIGGQEARAAHILAGALAALKKPQ
ncbi:MAG: L-seryl-tRNA(Sec) selenium transferase, partial [Gemmatimonadota bacterium]